MEYPVVYTTEETPLIKFVKSNGLLIDGSQRNDQQYQHMPIEYVNHISTYDMGNRHLYFSPVMFCLFKSFNTIKLVKKLLSAGAKLDLPILRYNSCGEFFTSELYMAVAWHDYIIKPIKLILSAYANPNILIQNVNYTEKNDRSLFYWYTHHNSLPKDSLNYLKITKNKNIIIKYRQKYKYIFLCKNISRK